MKSAKVIILEFKIIKWKIVLCTKLDVKCFKTLPIHISVVSLSSGIVFQTLTPDSNKSIEKTSASISASKPMGSVNF